MWNPFRRSPSTVEVLAETLRAVQASNQELAHTATQALALLQTFYESYKVTEPPQVRVMSDEREYQLEQEQIEAAQIGHPTTPYPPAWISTSLNEEP